MKLTTTTYQAIPGMFMTSALLPAAREPEFEITRSPLTAVV